MGFMTLIMNHQIRSVVVKQSGSSESKQSYNHINAQYQDISIRENLYNSFMTMLWHFHSYKYIQKMYTVTLALL